MTRLRPVLVILAILAVLLVAMAVQTAKQQAGQLPGANAAEPAR